MLYKWTVGAYINCIENFCICSFPIYAKSHAFEGISSIRTSYKWKSLTCQLASAPDHHNLCVVPEFFRDFGGSRGYFKGPSLAVLVVVQHRAGCWRNHRAFPRS